MRKSSEDKILYLLKSRGALTAEQVGAALAITTAGAQQQLARLADLGLVEGEERKQKRGRPRKYWQLTEKGHSRFPDRHSDLTLELINSINDLFGETGMEQLIKQREVVTYQRYSEALSGCRSLKSRVSKLANIRSEEGYMAEYTEEEGVFFLIENHCPICAAAKLCTGFCRSELELFQAVLGDTVAVEREEHIVTGARRCCYRIYER